MKSHFQSSDTTWISSGLTRDASGRAGSSRNELVHATPPRKKMTSAGIDQVMSSMRPECVKVGQYGARLFEALKRKAITSVAMITGMTIASIIASASNRILRSAALTGPAGSSSAPPQALRHASAASAPSQPATRAAPRRLTAGENLHVAVMFADKLPGTAQASHGATVRAAPCSVAQCLLPEVF